jgi:hypothetical protein
LGEIILKSLAAVVFAETAFEAEAAAGAEVDCGFGEAEATGVMR